MSRLGRLEFGSWQINCVSTRIDAHCSRPLRRFHRLRYFKLALRFFSDNHKRTVAAACECLTVVEFCRVYSCADRQARQDFAIFGTHDHHLLGLTAADEEAPSPRIQCKPNRLTAGSYGPMGKYFARGQVDDRELIFVFQVDIDLAMTVRSEKLGLAA